MDITRDGQTITFDTNPDRTQDAELVQTSDYLNSAGLPVPVQNIVVKGRRVVASTGFLARQALREHDAQVDAANVEPPTYHPGRCYCVVFAGSHHVPGMRQVGAYGSVCKGDRVAPHDETTCPACLAGATDYRPTIEAGQTWISQHGTDHQVAGPGDEEGTWAMWGPTGHLYVISDARLYTAYTLDLDR